MAYAISEELDPILSPFVGGLYELEEYDEPVVRTRHRRNAFAGAFAGSSGGCGAGAFALASASGTQCIQSSGGDFSAVAAGIHSHVSQMMNDMVSKFHNSRPQYSSSSGGSSHYSGGVLNVQVSGGGGGSPCGKSQQPTSYGGCAPAPSYAQPAPQAHRIQIHISGGGQQQQQPPYQAPAPSPCGGGSSPSPSGGCVMHQPNQPAYQPSYAPSGVYSDSGSSSYSASASAPYSTSVDAQPSYGPVDAYHQQQQQYAPVPQPGAQFHASQKSSQSGQSFSVPVGNTRLTIQIHHDGQEQAQPAPAPSPCGSSPCGGSPSPQGYAQYAASGSQQSQYAVAGQIPYGGGAEPRLQYCNPGSNEKGVCLNQGDEAAALEPTRSKRAAADVPANATSGGGFSVTPYITALRRTMRNAWRTFMEQPEVEYITGAFYFGPGVAQRSTSTLAAWFFQIPSERAIHRYLASFTPTVTTFVTKTVMGVTVEQQLPFGLRSLRRPVPTVVAVSIAAANLPSLISPAGTASIRNGRVVNTFGKLTYTLNPVPCRYLFVHDFDDGNFTVLLTYAGSRGAVQLTAIDVVGRESSYRIDATAGAINNVTRRVSTKFPDFKVTATAGKVLITSPLGWDVVYTSKGPEDQELVVRVTGMYSSKVAGLAGSFDLLPHNDFLTPARLALPRSRLGTFVDAWQVEDSCGAGSVAN